MGLPEGRLLDAPAGEGAVSMRLKERFKVHALDIDENYFKLEDIPFTKCDLNTSLPFGDASFDYVVSVEGIEHLENPFLCIREFSRILRPEGHLIITTPNILSIKSRTRFFFYSYHDFFRFIRPPLKFRHKMPEYEHEHINPMTYHELRYALEKAGLRIENISTNRYIKARRLGPVYPIIKRLIINLTQKRYPDDRYLISDEVLEGEIIIIHGKKSG